MVRHHLADQLPKRPHNQPYPPAPAAPRPRLRAHWRVGDDGKLSCRWEVEP